MAKQITSPEPEPEKPVLPTPPRFMARHLDPNGNSNIGEMCNFFRISRSTFARWERQGITPVKGRLVNGLVRYRNSEMLEAMREAEVA
ncbi:MAG: helix-turn-helix domain-containing protein [Alphaproteobacteria bacterium]|nr:helix-turn-helix domain-containing protein [Alphaproteobacteria bacterium]